MSVINDTKEKNSDDSNTDSETEDVSKVTTEMDTVAEDFQKIDDKNAEKFHVSDPSLVILVDVEAKNIPGTGCIDMENAVMSSEEGNSISTTPVSGAVVQNVEQSESQIKESSQPMTVSDDESRLLIVEDDSKGEKTEKMKVDDVTYSSDEGEGTVQIENLSQGNATSKFDLSPKELLKEVNRKVVKARRRFPYENNVNMPEIMKAFEQGWRRQIVFRSTEASRSGNRADIYYFTPGGKKLRSKVEIESFLRQSRNMSLNLSNFTFSKEPLGVDAKFEEVRHALQGSTPGRVAGSSSAQSKIESEVTTQGDGRAVKRGRPPKKYSPELEMKRPKKTHLGVSFVQRLGMGGIKLVHIHGTKGNCDTSIDSNKPLFTKLIPQRVISQPGKVVTPQLIGDMKTRTFHCTAMCNDTADSVPSLQCLQCLCLFHPECCCLPTYFVTTIGNGDAKFLCPNCHRSNKENNSPPNSSLFPPPHNPLAREPSSDSEDEFGIYCAKGAHGICRPFPATKHYIDVSLDPPEFKLADKMTSWTPRVFASTQVRPQPRVEMPASNSPVNLSSQQLHGKVMKITGGAGGKRVILVRSNTGGTSGQQNVFMAPRNIKPAGGAMPGTIFPTELSNLFLPNMMMGTAGMPNELPQGGTLQKNFPFLFANQQSFVAPQYSYVSGENLTSSEPFVMRESSIPNKPLPVSPLTRDLLADLSQNYRLLLRVFSYLSVQDLLVASRVCVMWRDLAYSPSLWISIRLRNICVRNWPHFGQFLCKRGTESINLAKMVMSRRRGARHNKDNEVKSKEKNMKVSIVEPISVAHLEKCLEVDEIDATEVEVEKKGETVDDDETFIAAVEGIGDSIDVVERKQEDNIEKSIGNQSEENKEANEKGSSVFTNVNEILESEMECIERNEKETSKVISPSLNGDLNVIYSIADDLVQFDDPQDKSTKVGIDGKEPGQDKQMEFCKTGSQEEGNAEQKEQLTENMFVTVGVETLKNSNDVSETNNNKVNGNTASSMPSTEETPEEPLMTLEECWSEICGTLASVPSLRTVTMPTCDAYALQTLLGSCRQLICIHATELRSPAGIVRFDPAYLAGTPNLTEVRLCGQKLSLTTNFNFMKLQQLRVLVLKGLSGPGVFWPHFGTTLTSLHVGPVTTFTANNWTNIASMKNLESLWLEDRQFYGDQEQLIYTALSGLSNLRRLCLFNFFIGARIGLTLRKLLQLQKVFVLAADTEQTLVEQQHGNVLTMTESLTHLADFIWTIRSDDVSCIDGKDHVQLFLAKGSAKNKELGEPSKPLTLAMSRVSMHIQRQLPKTCVRMIKLEASTASLIAMAGL